MNYDNNSIVLHLLIVLLRRSKLFRKETHRLLPPDMSCEYCFEWLCMLLLLLQYSYISDVLITHDQFLAPCCFLVLCALMIGAPAVSIMITDFDE